MSYFICPELDRRDETNKNRRRAFERHQVQFNSITEKLVNLYHFKIVKILTQLTDKVYIDRKGTLINTIISFCQF